MAFFDHWDLATLLMIAIVLKFSHSVTPIFLGIVMKTDFCRISGISPVCVCVFTPPLPWDGGTARTVIQVHAVNLIDIRLGEDGSPFRTSFE